MEEEGAAAAAPELPHKKQKTGACHKCSGVIKQEAKATVCPKCSCRCEKGAAPLPDSRVLSQRSHQHGQTFRKAFSDFALCRPCAHRYHTFDCGQRIFLAGHDALEATACPRVRPSSARIQGPCHAAGQDLTSARISRSAMPCACVEAERCGFRTLAFSAAGPAGRQCLFRAEPCIR